MNTVSVVVTGKDKAIARVDAITSGLRAVQRHVAADGAKLVRDAIRAEAPVRSGRTKAGVGYRTSIKGEAIQIRFHGTKKTHLVTKPTKPHDIWAGFYTGKSDKRFLFFEAGGAANVHHPGTAGNDFVHRGYDRAVAGVRELVRAAAASLMGR